MNQMVKYLMFVVKMFIKCNIFTDKLIESSGIPYSEIKQEVGTPKTLQTNRHSSTNR